MNCNNKRTTVWSFFGFVEPEFTYPTNPVPPERINAARARLANRCACVVGPWFLTLCLLGAMMLVTK